MSFPDERPFSRVSYYSSEDEEPTGVFRRGSRALRGRGFGLSLEMAHSGQGEGGFQGPWGYEFETEAREAVLWGREERPSTAIEDDGGGGGGGGDDDYNDNQDGKGDPSAPAALFSQESATTVIQQLLDRDAYGVRSFSPPQSCSVEVPSRWVARARGARILSRVEVPKASVAPLRVSGPERGRAWRVPERGSRGRLSVSGDWRWPTAEGLGTLPSDTESSDDVSELQMVRMRIYTKEVDAASASSPENAGDSAPASGFVGGESLCYMSGSSVPYAARGAPMAVGGQAAARRETSPAKHVAGTVWGKGRGRPSCSGACPTRSPPGARKKKELQDRKHLVSPSKVALGRIFPSWGQRVSAVPPEPASFPPIAGVPLLGSAKRLPQVPQPTKRPKPTGAVGKKCVARKPREREQVTGEDDDANRNPVTKDQKLPTHRPGPSSQSVYRRERSSGGNRDLRGLRVSGISLPLASDQGYASSRGPARSSDQEPPDRPSRQGRQQQLPGGQGCSQCVVLKEEITNLKDQIALLKSLSYKFQALSS